MKSALLSVFFDGRCIVCSHEIDLYRKRDIDGRIAFIDIMDPRFDPASAGLDPVAIHDQMHAKKASGEVVTGVDAFIAIWDVLPGGVFRALSRIARIRALRPALDLGYIAFAKARPYLPRRSRSEAEKEAVSQGFCADGYCELPAAEKARLRASGPATGAQTQTAMS
jgi:predicted DCC family thiol-disulfide oxidoreductase YuxK